MITLKAFSNNSAARIWQGRHLLQSSAKMIRFCNFNRFGEKPLDSFIPSDIYEFLDFLLKTGVCHNTANHYLAAIGAVFKFAREAELITHAPKVRWFKVISERPRYFTETEVKAMEKFFKTSDYPELWDFAYLSLNTGMRLGEILKMTPKMISPCGRFITLTGAICKNGSGRLIPLSEATRRTLIGLSDQPSKHYHHRPFYKVWSAARDTIAKDDKHFVFHVCRHTAATRMANEFKINTSIIGKILGHRTEKTTNKYIHAQQDTLLDIADMMTAN